jgi:hypothetical protein
MSDENFSQYSKNVYTLKLILTPEPNLNNPNSIHFLTKTMSVMSRTLVTVAGGQTEETRQAYEAIFFIRRMDRPLFGDSKSALSLRTVRI